MLQLAGIEFSKVSEMLRSSEVMSHNVVKFFNLQRNMHRLKSYYRFSYVGFLQLYKVNELNIRFSCTDLEYPRASGVKVQVKESSD